MGPVLDFVELELHRDDASLDHRALEVDVDFKAMLLVLGRALAIADLGIFEVYPNEREAAINREVLDIRVLGGVADKGSCAPVLLPVQRHYDQINWALELCGSEDSFLLAVRDECDKRVELDTLMLGVRTYPKCSATTTHQKHPFGLRQLSPVQ